MFGIVVTQDTAKALRLFSEAGLDTEQYMTAHGQKEFLLDFEKGEITLDEFCQRMAAACGRDSISADEATRCWQGFYAGVDTERLRSILKLREEYHVCLLSNINECMMKLTDSPRFSADGLPISHYFDSMFLSYQMHMYKPDAEFYLEACRRDGMNPAETVFIDDAIKNVEGARAAGLHAIHVPTNEDWRPHLAAFLQEQEKTSE